MLPTALVSAYREYKKDTDSIASWLASTAKAAGYTAFSTAKKQIAAANRQKSSNQASKHIISVSDFTSLSHFISKAKIPVPAPFSAVLGRVIAARAGFGTELQQYTNTIDKTANKKHAHFIEVLKNVQSILAPVTAGDAISDTTEGSTNRFKGLQVYEPSEEFLNAPPMERPTKVDNDPDSYEAESDSLIDAVFSFSILLNDMDRIRRSIRDIWFQYTCVEIDLATAAVATNAAVEVARNMSDEIMPLVNKHGGLGKVLNIVYIYSCVSAGVTEDDVISNRSYLRDGNNYDTYDIATDSFLNAYRLVDAFRDVLRPGELPMYKEGTYGYHNAASDHYTKSGKGKFFDDRALLIPFLGELAAALTVPSWPVEDEFMRGLREIASTRQIPFYMVFAAQVFLDTTYMLKRDIKRPWRDLSRQIRFMESDLDSHMKFHENLKIQNWPPSNDNMLRSVEVDIKLLQRDVLFEKQKAFHKRQGAHFGRSESDKHRIFRMSPVISGMMLMHFRTQYHQAGLAVANCWGSIQYAAHLQNAIRVPWQDMAMAKSLLGAGSFFVGGTPPKDPVDQLKKFSLQMGTTASAFTDRQRKGGMKNFQDWHSKAGPRGIKDNATVQLAFTKRYAANGPGRLTAEQILEFVRLGSENDDELSSQLKAMSIDGSSSKPSTSSKAKGKGKKTASSAQGDRIPPEKLIPLFAVVLEREVLEIAFPYLLFHRKCLELLRTVKNACDVNLRTTVGPAYIEEESQLPFVVGYILTQACKGDAPLLVNAAAAMNSWLVREGNGDFITKFPLSRLLGRKLGVPDATHKDFYLTRGLIEVAGDDSDSSDDGDEISFDNFNNIEGIVETLGERGFMGEQRVALLIQAMQQ